MLRQVMVALAACMLVGSYNSTAKAESLSSALVAAYVTNPTLNAERARLRAIDEEASQARSNLRPSLSGDLDTGYRNTNPKLKGGTPLGAGTHHPGVYGLSLNQTLFRGFRTLNAIREAEANIRSGRESLRSVQQATLLVSVTMR